MMNAQGRRVCRDYALMGVIAFAVHLFGDIALAATGVVVTVLVLRDLYQQWTA